MIQEKIQSLLGEVSSLTASDAQGLEELRIKYLSKKGVVNDLMNEFRNVPVDQKREIGMKLNELKTALQISSTSYVRIWLLRRTITPT